MYDLFKGFKIKNIYLLAIQLFGRQTISPSTRSRCTLPDGHRFSLNTLNIVLYVQEEMVQSKYFVIICSLKHDPTPKFKGPPQRLVNFYCFSWNLLIMMKI